MDFSLLNEAFCTKNSQPVSTGLPHEPRYLITLYPVRNTLRLIKNRKREFL